jgi:hypothetical protein
MEGVNLARPNKAKPKGRTIKSSEQQVLKFTTTHMVFCDKYLVTMKIFVISHFVL